MAKKNTKTPKEKANKALSDRIDLTERMRQSIWEFQAVGDLLTSSADADLLENTLHTTGNMLIEMSKRLYDDFEKLAELAGKSYEQLLKEAKEGQGHE